MYTLCTHIRTHVLYTYIKMYTCTYIVFTHDTQSTHGYTHKPVTMSTAFISRQHKDDEHTQLYTHITQTSL